MAHSLSSRAQPTILTWPRVALAAGALLVLVGSTAQFDSRCSAGEQPMMHAQLFFGRNIGAQHAVSDAQFKDFLDQSLTQRFPNGLTHMRARGQWQDEGQGTTREQSDLVTLLIPDNADSRTALEAARRDYMTRFRQNSVLLAHQEVCTRF